MNILGAETCELNCALEGGVAPFLGSGLKASAFRIAMTSARSDMEYACHLLDCNRGGREDSFRPFL